MQYFERIFDRYTNSKGQLKLQAPVLADITYIDLVPTM